VERISRWSFEKVQHILSGLLKVVVSGELGEGEFLWEEIDLEYVAFGHGVGEVTFLASVVFEGRADVPTNLSVGAEWCAGVGGGVGNDFGARRGEWSTIEVEVAEEGGMCRQRRMNARGAEQVES